MGRQHKISMAMKIRFSFDTIKIFGNTSLVMYCLSILLSALTAASDITACLAFSACWSSVGMVPGSPALLIARSSMARHPSSSSPHASSFSRNVASISPTICNTQKELQLSRLDGREIRTGIPFSDPPPAISPPPHLDYITGFLPFLWNSYKLL